MPFRLEQDLLLITEQARPRIVAFEEEQQVWEWSPLGPPEWWGCPSDVRVRVDDAGKPVMLVADSFGYVGVVDGRGYEQWSVNCGRESNPHAAELLSGERVAVAASDGGSLRIYDASSSAAEAIEEIQLTGAHGVVWDTATQCLWALGDTELVCIEDLGGKSQITARHTIPVVGGGVAEGHDLARAQGVASALWVTTRDNVYRFSMASSTWNLVDHIALQGKGDVKSMSEHPARGRLAWTVARAPEWWTDSVHLDGPQGTLLYPNARIYKARWCAEGMQ